MTKITLHRSLFAIFTKIHHKLLLNDAFDSTFEQRNREEMSSFPKPEQNSIDLGFMEAFDPTTYQRLIELGLTKEQIEKTINENNETNLSFDNSDAPQMTNEDY